MTNNATEKRIWAAYASYRLVELRGEYYIEDESDGSQSSPLDPEFARFFVARPSRLLDIVMLCPTPRISVDVHPNCMGN